MRERVAVVRVAVVVQVGRGVATAQVEGDTVSNVRTRNGPISIVQEDTVRSLRLGALTDLHAHFPIRLHEQELVVLKYSCHGAPDLFLTKRLVSMMYHSDLSLQFLKLQH